jgi:hypothetical protein
MTRSVSNIPNTLEQNPSPSVGEKGQEYQQTKTQLVEGILSAFRTVLPSNYVATTNGPWYSLQFQAMAEQLADIQIEGTEVYLDSGWDFTRPEFLWQLLGSVVFPGASDRSGIPQIDGDVPYRTFLKTMVSMLLEGATKSSLEGGLEALNSDIVAHITERYLQAPPRAEAGGYTIADQFTIDVKVETNGGTEFPSDPIAYQSNAKLVLAALKPAHVLYSFSYLFRDTFEQMEETGLSLDIDSYYYDDQRKFWLGDQRISGEGEILSNRSLLSDPTLSFEAIRPGAIVNILGGTNEGRYTVKNTQCLASGLDLTPRAYTTSPSGLSGSATAYSDSELEDAAQDWGTAELDETITISAGPNAGTYRLDRVLGETGGIIGTPGISGTKVRLAPSILKLDRRAPSAEAVSYEVGVDRLGVQTPRVVTSEDASIQFWE